jgi:transposase InsO family protein
VRALCAKRRVVAVPWVDPRLIGGTPEDALFQAAHQAVESFWSCCPPRTAGEQEFTMAFDAVFAAAGVRIIKTPVRPPRANAIAERWVGSALCECPDRMLITGERHLRLVLGEYTDRYDSHRPHRALQQEPPAGRADPPGELTSMSVQRSTLPLSATSTNYMADLAAAQESRITAGPR